MYRKPRPTRKFSTFRLGGDLPADLPAIDGDPSGVPEDPLDPAGGLAGAIDDAAAGAESAITSAAGNGGLPDDVVADAPQLATDAMTENLSSEVKVSGNGGIVGQSIQLSVTEDIAGDPEDLANKATGDAIEAAGNVPSEVTTDQLKAGYDQEVQAKITDAKSQIKADYKQVIEDYFSTDPDLKLETDLQSPDQLISDAVEDPDGTEESLNQQAEQLGQAEPDWKTKLKENGMKLAEYGGKALLILVVIGAFFPGGTNVVDKLASMAGTAVGKLITAAANIIKAFFGPLIKSFWNIVKSLKTPLIIIGAIILIMIILWIIKTIRGK